MLEKLVELSDRDFARLLAAIGRARLADAFASSIVEDEEPDPIMVRLAEEYRSSGGFKPRNGKPPKPPDWHALLTKDAKGIIEKGMVNVLIAMREDPAISGVLGYEDRIGKVVLKGRLPDDWEPDFQMRVIEERDFLSLYEYLVRCGFRLTKDEMKTVIRKVARENPL